MTTTAMNIAPRWVALLMQNPWKERARDAEERNLSLQRVITGLYRQNDTLTEELVELRRIRVELVKRNDAQAEAIKLLQDNLTKRDRQIEQLQQRMDNGYGRLVQELAKKGLLKDIDPNLFQP